MSDIHIVMMGKGGVGKSTVSVLLSQYLRTVSDNLHFADLDPTNASFCAFKDIGAEHFKIADDDFNIEPRAFDLLIEKILGDDSTWVIDTGAATFLPFMNYVVNNEVFDFLAEQGRRVIVHTPLVGGPAMEETLRGLQAILELGTSPVVVWENEYYGPVTMNGKRFVQTTAYEKHKARVLGVVRLKKGDEKQIETDMSQMLSRRLTWDQAKVDSSFLVMQRQRLAVARRDIDGEIGKLPI